MLFRIVAIVYLIKHRFDGNLFNLRMLQAESKVQTEVLDEFPFADGIAKGLQQKKRCKNVWINYLIQWQLWSHSQHKKTVGISASTLKALQGAYYHSERSTIASGKQVHLLGSTLSRVVHIDDEVNTRIAKASSKWPTTWKYIYLCEVSYLFLVLSCLLLIPCSLLLILVRCYLFIVPCYLFLDPCYLFLVPCYLFIVPCHLFFAPFSFLLIPCYL